MINGKRPYKGATMYDIQHGFGTVTQVEPDDSFELDFRSGRTFRYSAGGYVGRSRRVYWNNPIVVEPTDDSQSWETFLNMARPMYKLVSSLTSRYKVQSHE